MRVIDWLHSAVADARRRQRPDLEPLLEGLAATLTALRAADWNVHADGPTPSSPTSLPPPGDAASAAGGPRA
jgi:hypothetical protein